MHKILNKMSQEDKDEYESFVKNHVNGNFMQSLNWTDVKCNWKYEAVYVRDSNGQISGTALVLIKTIPLIRRSFLYCPHGPVCDYTDKETLSELLVAIEELAEKYNAYQLKIDPCITESDHDAIETFRLLGLVYHENAPELSTIQARNNYMLFFNGRTKEELFASFHKKWRYNIRVAERHGVECKVCGKEALDEFYMLMQETGRRDGFSIRGKSYFERMLDSLGENCRLYMCYKDGKPLSGALCVKYAGKSCYVYGASTAENRESMPNYLMQWKMICDASDSGCTVHDFQGIPFYKDETHPNYGVYRFKKGFNGEVVTYAGEFDYTYNHLLSKISEKGQNFRNYIRTQETRRLLKKSENFQLKEIKPQTSIKQEAVLNIILP